MDLATDSNTAAYQDTATCLAANAPLSSGADGEIARDEGVRASAANPSLLETPAEKLAAIASAVSSKQLNKTLQVLIVEPDPVFAHLLERYLRQDRKHEFATEICENAATAIEKCRQKKFDVVLIDYNLPDSSGTRLLQELRTRLPTPSPPGILLSADNSAVIARLAEKSSAADLLLKQVVSTSSLSRSIENAISKSNLQNVINKRTIDLEKTNKMLISKNREIQSYYQKVSHEVKTPLAAVREFISIIRDEILGPISEEQREVIDLAITSCDQISNHFNDLVQISRLDAGRILLRKKLTSIQNVVKRSLAATASSISEAGLEITEELEDPDAHTCMDADRIAQVVSNLIGNAIKFTPAGGSVKISVIDNGKGFLQFCIADTGCGIAEEHRQHIFERLYQVSDESHESFGAGLGLGLTIASEIVHLHRGEIWVESELGVGSEFYFTVPIQHETCDEADHEDEPADHPGGH